MKTNYVKRFFPSICYITFIRDKNSCLCSNVKICLSRFSVTTSVAQAFTVGVGGGGPGFDFCQDLFEKRSFLHQFLSGNQGVNSLYSGTTTVNWCGFLEHYNYLYKLSKFASESWASVQYTRVYLTISKSDCFYVSSSVRSFLFLYNIKCRVVSYEV